MDRPTTLIGVRLRNGGEVILEPDDRYQVLGDDDPSQWRRARDLAVGDVLQGRGRITVVWGADARIELVVETAKEGQPCGDS